MGVVVEFYIHCLINRELLVTNNYGISLSMNWINPLLLNIIFVLIISWLYLKNNSYVLVLILIGGIVNMVDRLTFGYVRDYWNFGGLFINNLNDWLIGFGVLLFVLENLWKKQK